MTTPKDYLGVEGARNKQHAKLFTDLIKAAYGETNDVLVGHHLCFEVHGNIDTENEIPAADTLIFCHDLMKAVFGEKAIPLMMELAAIPPELRDEHLALHFYNRA